MLAVYIASHFIPLRFLPDESAPPTSAEEPPATVQADTPATTPEPTYRAFGSFLLVDGAPDIIALDGEITTNSPLDFRRALKARPDAKTLVLKSNGGVVSSGLLIAHEVKERGMNTVILPSMGCYSACAFIFFAGNDRHAAGELGVHQIWSETPDLSSAQTTLSDILEAMDEFGVPHEVVSIMLRTPASEMHVFTSDEIAALSINRGNLPSDADAQGTKPVKKIASPVAGRSAVQEDMTVMPKPSFGKTTDDYERVLVVDEPSTVRGVLQENGFTPAMTAAIEATIREAYPSGYLSVGSRLHILFGPSRSSDTLIPYRMSIYVHDIAANSERHAVTVALTDKGQYVLGLEPGTGPPDPFAGTREDKVARMRAGIGS
jgi:hypothetical protein